MLIFVRITCNRSEFMLVQPDVHPDVQAKSKGTPALLGFWTKVG